MLELHALFLVSSIYMSISEKERIVVIGFGWVGQANALALKQSGHNVSYFDIVQTTLHYKDKYESLYNILKPLKTLLENDSQDTWYIVCVGDRVSPEGEQDISAIRKVLELLKDVKGRVILRSTILPGYLASLKFDYYIPEFLHEKKAVEESIKPQFFVLGIRNNKISLPAFLVEWRDGASKSFIGTPEQAAYIKYLSNSWNALRIAFVNEFGNAIAFPDSREQVMDIEKVINFLFEEKAYLRYGRSYGGHCLPKDTRAFINWHKKNGKNVPLMEGMHASNEIHRLIEQKNPYLKEWFSEWVRPQISGRAALAALWFSIDKKMKAVINKVISKAM